MSGDESSFIASMTGLTPEPALPQALVSQPSNPSNQHVDSTQSGIKAQSNPTTRVLIIDDDLVVREFIQTELIKDGRIHLVGQAGSVKEGRKLISHHHVNVMLVDLNLSDGNGFELIEFLKVKHPTAEAIVISALEDEQHALHAFELGATGYLIKNSGFGNFAQAIFQVMNGGASISPSLARRLLQRLEHTDSFSANTRKESEHESLTSREKAVLKMITFGYTSPEIAQRMGISTLTVSTHCKNIYRKLHVKNRAQAVSMASSQGLLL